MQQKQLAPKGMGMGRQGRCCVGNLSRVVRGGSGKAEVGYMSTTRASLMFALGKETLK